MIDLEIRLLFLNYCEEKNCLLKKINDSDEKTSKKLFKNKITNIEKLQLGLIHQYLIEVNPTLPVEMQSFFNDDNIEFDNKKLIVNWLTNYYLLGVK